MSIHHLPPLLDTLTLLITQYRLGASMTDRHQTVKGLRSLITKAIQETILQQSSTLQDMRLALERGLAVVEHNCAAGTDPGLSDHIDHCLREVRLAFELAEQVWEEHRNDAVTAQMLIEDLPILRPFEYGTPSSPAQNPLPR
ncbi:MAG: hypothetical protein HY696_12705 [Deltaproteobacteria bacterium]|nr:hypothetical protein [Deltaproteobacteria bacterium]